MSGARVTVRTNLAVSSVPANTVSVELESFGSWVNSFYVLDAHAQLIVAEYAGHTSNVSTIALHPTQPLLLSGSYDKSAHLIALPPALAGEPLHLHNVHKCHSSCSTIIP